MENMKELADLLWESKMEIKALNSQVNELKKKRDDYEYRLIQVLNANGIEQIRNDNATFTVKTTINPQATDWEQIHKWVKDNNAFHLLYKQISPTAYREFLELGEEIPGIDSYEKTSIATLTR